MLRRYVFRMEFLTSLTILLVAATTPGAETQIDFRAAPHTYFQHQPQDRFARLQKELESGKVKLDTENDKAFVASLLKALDIPASSQLLVFSASSLQSEIINPRNPRALYFNEDTYFGYVPGGRVEVIGMDPQYGPMFYVFDRLNPGGRAPAAVRSEKCFNCHAGNATHRVPGLIAESTLPMMSGASIETYRRDVQGHQIPLADRFGGWHLTGQHHLEETHANEMGITRSSGKTERRHIEPGQLSNLDLHLLPTSDILPNLIHEHQIGFENRVFRAAYLMRQWLSTGKGQIPKANQMEFERQADDLTRYILFADEAKLPAQGIEGDADFMRDFARNRRPSADGASLKDLELRSRILKYRCSYMIYTDSWQELPTQLKERVYYKMAEGLRDANPSPALAHIPLEERRAVRTILKETLPGLPSWWR